MNKKTIYIAFDGKVFGWKIECLEYEAELKKTGVKTVKLDAFVRQSVLPADVLLAEIDLQLRIIKQILDTPKIDDNYKHCYEGMRAAYKELKKLIANKTA